MNTKLINTTNTAFKIYINEKGYIEYNKTNTRLYFYAYSDREFSFGTTDILEFKRDDNILEVKTLNSIYTFEVDKSVVNPKIAILTDCQKLIIKYMKNVKSNCFSCTSYNVYTLERIMSFVTFETKITRNEAMQKLVKNKPLFDMYGDIVTNIDQAGTPNEKILDLKIYDKYSICLDDIKDEEFKECLNAFLYGRNCIKKDDKVFVHLTDFREFLSF